jgi:hypothetical protein
MGSLQSPLITLSTTFGCYCQSYSDRVDIHVLTELNSGAIVSVIVIVLICKFWFSLQGLQMYICLDVVDKVINGDCRDPINWFNPAQSLYLSYDRA